ncbi:MAG: thiamine biosynthesis protein ThiF family 2 [Candidatus Saganbacteria bacterium]|uniref:Thiamine biosynthesis protein ThiF family 2 n=1 Tax=Candidatus Saganbacteria bacterium TaxID=2575572 RepID=A0A833L1V2_UNCSA|nr:MAG: thiamine biosynthesis protein ThiF family 2 [Candidatus Saganbacteria bacterium]
MNDFEQALTNYFLPEQLAKIEKTKIGIAGCGGLGSNIVVCLVRSGFKNFELMDFDVVETKNLNRQYYYLDEVGQSKVDVLSTRLLKINPDLKIKKVKAQLSDENIASYFQDRDIIFEAFDNVPSKKLIMETFGNTNKLLIFGCGMAGITNQSEIKIKKIKNNIYMVGDGVTCVGPENPPLAPRVFACASLMASAALEAVLYNIPA